jgi:hypothetical protein
MAAFRRAALQRPTVPIVILRPFLRAAMARIQVIEKNDVEKGTGYFYVPIIFDKAKAAEAAGR